MSKTLRPAGTPLSVSRGGRRLDLCQVLDGVVELYYLFIYI